MHKSTLSYTTLIQRLFNVNLFGGVKLGLQNMQTLQKLLHYPDHSFPSIHVAGTNGKGSVCTKIASAFEHAGYCVGLYTSPHLACFRERIRINGKMISENAVEVLLSRLFNMVDAKSIPATFFELTTLLAFLYFSQEKVDIAVIETGLGGRLDATNILHPCLSVITSISLDHTEILGVTREEITQEKGGIIKAKVPVVIGPHVPFTPIQAIAVQKQSICIPVNSSSPLFEEENRLIAQTALEYLASDYHLSPTAIEQGLEGKQPCRFEIVPGSPCTILDVAHNPDGMQHLFQMMQSRYPGQSVRLLFGLSKNKDLLGCLQVLATLGTHFHLVQASNGRGLPVQELAMALHNQGVDPTHFFVHESIAEGVCHAQQAARQNKQILVICGSFFIMGQVRQALGFIEPFDIIDLNERKT